MKTCVLLLDPRSSWIRVITLSTPPWTTSALILFWKKIQLKTTICKGIQPVHLEGDQPWDFFGGNDAEAETPVLLATSCEELTHWKRLWCWEGLGAGGEGDHRGWDGWMASWAWWMLSLSELRELVMDRETWRAMIPGVAKSRTLLSDWTELNWTK